jgi:hypothetical protein
MHHASCGLWAAARSPPRPTTSTTFAHLAPTIGLGRVPDPKPAPKGPVERGACVFVGCGVCGVKNHFLTTPPPIGQAEMAVEPRYCGPSYAPPPSPLFWPPSAGERAPP